MIPKVIHYCWFGGNPRNELITRCMESWNLILPDYEIKEWNETNSPVEIPYCKAAHEKELWSKVANYVRLWALYNEGGLYLDTDVQVLKRFDDLLHLDCFLGFQDVQERKGWVANGVIGAKKANDFMKKCMDKTLEIFEEKNEFIISPQMTTLVLKEMGLKEYGYQVIDDVTLFPVEYFYPYTWLVDYDPSYITPNTYSVHHWNMSWVKNKPIRKK